MFMERREKAMVQIDIEMPIYCYDCPCHNGENGRCNITGDSTYDKRPFDCPLKEVKLADLPSKQPEQKKGKWICHDAKEGYLIEKYSCSICNYYSDTKRTHFCPNCGAEMI